MIFDLRVLRNRINIPLFLSLIVLLAVSCTDRTAEISLHSLVEEMTARHNLACFPSPPYKLKQVSSYNPMSKIPGEEGWYANFDRSHFQGIDTIEGRREFVLFDVSGPGVVVRWWMTFYKAQNGILRIYIDGNSIPEVSGSPKELLSGTLLADYPFSVSLQEGAAIGEEGRDYDHNLYLPIPFSEHCKITYECDSLVMLYEYEGIQVEEGFLWPDVFYNINYREYDPDVQVESFSLDDLYKVKPLLERAGELLLSEEMTSKETIPYHSVILPGDTLEIEVVRERSAVDHILTKIESADMDQALRSVVIAITFDGLQTVWVPVGEFFGTGHFYSTHSTWMNRTYEDGRMISKWVMPFKRDCIISFINFASDTVFIQGDLGMSNYRWKENSLYFGASWHEYRHIRTRDENGSMFDLNFVDIGGKGIYAGDQITLFNSTWHWWGEGDEKIFVDGEAFPSSFGTGSEDYYGYSFGRPDPFSHPFLSQPVGTGNTSWGPTVNMRQRSLDAIPFSSSINSYIELWHWADTRINYALTTYWYVMPPYTVNVQPDSASVKFPVARSKEDILLK